MYEDQAFITKICLHEPVYVSSRCWDRYRLHCESIVAKATTSGQLAVARRFYYEWLLDYLSGQGFDDGRAMRRIRLTRWACKYRLLVRMTKPARMLLNKLLGLGADQQVRMEANSVRPVLAEALSIHRRAIELAPGETDQHRLMND
jgi:hypothetical protein